ncbi:condensation domain-containing protein, partial [Xenorhabdus cabanillasii]
LARYPLSFAQERMLFIEQFEQGAYAYHIPYLVQLHEGVKLSLLESAINRVIERHNVLKTVYRSDDEGYGYQQVLEDDLLIESHFCTSGEALLHTVHAELSTSFNLTTEPGL